MEFVTDPAFLMAFAIALAAHVTVGGQVRQILRQRASEAVKK
jgi:hypothetical protein